MLEVAIEKRRRELRVAAEFQLEEGGALGLFGPSGAGKSTVLACLAGMADPERGVIAFQGRRLFPPPVPMHLRAIGYLTQEPNLFPHLSVADNVTFGLPAGRRAGEQAWVARLAERLQLGSCWSAPANRISGGQARRVSLARMLARRPPLVLLDEPFAGLDRGGARALMTALLEWKQEIGFTMIAVDHQAEILGRLCPRALVMQAGRVVQQGNWEELRQAPEPGLAELLAPL